MNSNLLSDIIRLAYRNPNLRPHLLPIIKTATAVREAIRLSMDNLDPDLQAAILRFADGVLENEAPRLERRTRELYRGFEPLRRILPSKITLYRGGPKKPPKVKRKWLSWSPDPAIAAHFGPAPKRQVHRAEVRSKDVVAGILSPSNPNYVEFLVRNRPEYLAGEVRSLPRWYSLSGELDWEWDEENDMPVATYDDSWVAPAVREIEALGGMRIRVREADPVENIATSIVFLMPDGEHPSDLGRFGELLAMGQSAKSFEWR